MQNIFTPEVFSYVINDIQYLTYSQAIPPDAQTIEEIDFYLIMFANQENLQRPQQTLEKHFAVTYMQCLLIVLFSLTIIVVLTMLVAWYTGWQIATPVQDMTRYTNRMKLAPSLAKKIKIVDELSYERRFKDINK